MRQPVIAIEGLIGCGKTTLCQWIRRNTRLLVADESESPLLTAFYNDKKRWAFATQIDLLTQRSAMLRTAQRASEKRGVILDRSVCGDRAFSRCQWQMGYLCSDEYRLYNDIYETLLEHDMMPDIILYLDVPVETCIKRIEKRGRNEQVDRHYLCTLANNYRTVLDEYESRGARVIRKMWDMDLDKHVYATHADTLISTVIRDYELT